MNHSIHRVERDQCDEFIAYLNDHLSDNGNSGHGYFQPLSRANLCYPINQIEAFRNSLDIEISAKGWRRVWVMRSEQGRIAAHITLRGHSENYTAHRCLLGMGVDRSHRRRGLGSALIQHVCAWSLCVEHLKWIDLQVVDGNNSAIALYTTAGFVETGRVDEMFEVDGKYLSSVAMALSLDRLRKK